MKEEEIIEEVEKELKLAKNIDDVATTIRNEYIEGLLDLYNKQNNKIQKAIDFINDEDNFFEDGENWQNVLKIKEILEEEN